MRLTLVPIILSALLSSITVSMIQAAPLDYDRNETIWDSLPDTPPFSVEVDTYLGQKTRRHNGGGRVWANLNYGSTTLKPLDQDRIRPEFYGLQVGFDLRRAHGIYSTFFLNINQTKGKYVGDKSVIDNYLLGFGKFFYMKGCHFAFSGNVGYDQYQITSIEQNSGNGVQTNLFGEFGLNLPLGGWSFKPFYALQYDFLYQGSISNSSSVLKSDWSGHSLNQLLGLRLNWQLFDRLELQSRYVWIHEMLDNLPPYYHVRFSPMHGVQTPTIMYYNGNTGRDWAWLGFGGKLEGIFNIYLFFDYDVLFNERHITHNGSLGLCLGW